MKLLLLLCPFLLLAQYVSFFKTSHDFGAVAEGQESIAEFHFKNLTSDTLKFDHGSIRSSCGCVVGTITRVVPPSGTGIATAKFSSTGRQGMFNKTLTFRYHEQSEVLLIQGHVFPKDTISYTDAQLKNSPRLVLEKNNIDVGTVRSGLVYTANVKIRNKGNDTLKLSNALSGCGGCIQVEMFSGKTPAKTTFLKSGEKGYLVLSYTPTGRSFHNVLILITNDKRSQRHQITVTGAPEN